MAATNQPTRAAPTAPSRYQATPVKDMSSLGTPTQQQILDQQIRLATDQNSPATRQALLSNPNLLAALRDPEKAKALYANPEFNALLPKLKEDAAALPPTKGPDGATINNAAVMTNALNEYAQNAPPAAPPAVPASQLAPAMGPGEGAPRASQPARLAPSI